MSLASQNSVLLVGLGPARDVLHRAGVHQLDLQPGGLQDRVPDPPVIRGALDRDYLDALAAQVIAQRRDLAHRRGHRPDPRPAPARPAVVRDPGADHPGRLGDVDRGDPVPGPLVLLVLDYLLRLLHAARLPRALADGKRRAARGAPVGSEKLTGALAAAIRDPSGSRPRARLGYGIKCQEAPGFGCGQPALILPPRLARAPAFTAIASQTTGRQRPRPRSHPHLAQFSRPRGARTVKIGWDVVPACWREHSFIRSLIVLPQAADEIRCCGRENRCGFSWAMTGLRTITTWR